MAAHRHGIRRITPEYLLIDIQPDADNAIHDGTALQSVLYQDATDLLVTDIDVIRPFDFHLIIYIGLQRCA